jgi:hypothetical protein
VLQRLHEHDDQKQGPLSTLTTEDLMRLAVAGQIFTTCQTALFAGRTSPISRIAKNVRSLNRDTHYPEGDVYDQETASQYYFHSHRHANEEHGHFHTFLRARAIPAGIRPAPYGGRAKRPIGRDAVCHLIAVSTDTEGHPTSLFTTNRWVTGESFYAAHDVIALLPLFRITRETPCQTTNAWLTALIQLFAPQIAMLLRARDARILAWKAEHPKCDAFEDRNLEVTSSIAINPQLQIADVADELDRRGLTNLSSLKK